MDFFDSAPDFLADGWSASPEDLLDSFLSIDGDFLRELDDTTEANILASSQQPPQTVSLPAPVSSMADLKDDLHGFLSVAQTQYDMSQYLNFDTNAVSQTLSSRSSDSGLSSDNMDMDISPDYGPLSPAMSSPGPSISERGGKNSPARSVVSEASTGPIAQIAPETIPVAVKSPAAAIAKPLQQQSAPQQAQLPPIPAVHSLASPSNPAGKPKPIMIASPALTTTNTKPRYVIEKHVQPQLQPTQAAFVPAPQIAVPAKAPVAVAQKRPATAMVQPQNAAIRKEVKIFKMAPAPAQTPPMVVPKAMPSQQPVQSQQPQLQQRQPAPQPQQQAKKFTVQQMKDGTFTMAGATMAGSAKPQQPTTYMLKKTGPNGTTTTTTGIRKLVRLQNSNGVGSPIGANAASAAGRAIVLPVSFQDVKDFRTIKIINASNMNNKSANIKLAAANLLQQSKQGLVQKNVLFSKEQLIDDSLSDPCTSDADSYVYEELPPQPQPQQQPQQQHRRQSVVSMAEAKAAQQKYNHMQRNVIINRGAPVKVQPQQQYTIMPSRHQPKHTVTISDADDDDDDDDDDESSDYMNGQSTGMQPNGTYPKLLLSNEEKRLLDKEGISLPGNYPLTKHEERELKRIRRKIRNKISAQDSRKRKKEYVDGLEERVKQCTDENQSLIKRLKLLQSQHTNLSHQVKKLQAMLSKSGGAGAMMGQVAGGGATGANKLTQPATCLMVLLLSLALVAAPNLKLGQHDKDVELADALQQSLQNRRSLLFDATGQDGSAMLDDDLMTMDEALTFGGEQTDDADATGDAKQPRTFVDFDLDDALPWKHQPDMQPDTAKTAAGVFAERAAEFQDALRAASPHIIEHMNGPAKLTVGDGGGLFEVKLEPLLASTGAAELMHTSKLNESHLAANGDRPIRMHQDA